MHRQRLPCIFFCLLLPLVIVVFPVSASQPKEPVAGKNIFLILTSTPGPDGTITHVVQEGENLYSIAVAYGMTINQLKELNKLSSNDIFVGQKLLIKLGNTPTVTGTPTVTPTRTPRPTRTPTQPPPTLEPTLTGTPTEIPPTPTKPGILSFTSVLPPVDPLLIAILGVGGLGVLLIIIGSVLKKKP